MTFQVLYFRLNEDQPPEHYGCPVRNKSESHLITIVSCLCSMPYYIQKKGYETLSFLPAGFQFYVQYESCSITQVKLMYIKQNLHLKTQHQPTENHSTIYNTSKQLTGLQVKENLQVHSSKISGGTP